MLSVHVGVSDGILITTAHRVDAVYDTRVLPRGKPLLTSGRMLYVLLEGTLHWHPTGEILEAPLVAVLNHGDLEGSSADGTTLRTEGKVLRAVEIRISREAAGIFGPVRCDDAHLVAAAERYFRAAESAANDDELMSLARTLTSELHRAGLVRWDITGAIRPSSPALAAIWRAFAGAIEERDFGATLGMVADRLGLSERQANRYVAALSSWLDIDYSGWRDAAQRWRIRFAIVLLSNPNASIAEIAKAVGYARAEAMATAFKQVELPSPREVRLRILANEAVSAPPERALLEARVRVAG